MKTFHVIGLMSGSSMDGVDLASVIFELDENNAIQTWKMNVGTTIPYTDNMVHRLLEATTTSGKELWQLHIDLGHALGQMVVEFKTTNHLKPDFIASHGHTIFHEPRHRMTCQIGDGAALAAIAGIPVVSDFRSTNMAYGGQGAPLAPLADNLLFTEYHLFLNLGGIANLSCTLPDHKIAYDLCACNQLFNYFSNKKGLAYDAGGQLARTGIIREELNNYLNQWKYYTQPIPKSLDNTEVKNLILEMDKKYSYRPEDFLRTGVEHISQKIAASFNELEAGSGGDIFATGGGAFHHFLIEEIQSKLLPDFNVIIPSSELIEFKEALLMALAGVRRWHGQSIFDARLTNASQACTGGAVYWPS